MVHVITSGLYTDNLCLVANYRFYHYINVHLDVCENKQLQN